VKVGEVEDGELGQAPAQFVNELDSGRALDPRVGDDEMTRVERGGKLDRGDGIEGVEDGVAFLPQHADDERDDGLIFVGDDDPQGSEVTGSWGTHCTHLRARKSVRE